MARARRGRRSSRPRLTLGLLVLASITIITLDFRGSGHGAIGDLKRLAHATFSPVQGALDAVAKPIAGFLAGTVNSGALQEQNAKLRSAVGRLQRQGLTQGDAKDELDASRELTSLPWAAGIPAVAAEVVAQSSSNFASTVQLNVGEAQGVDVGMPVVGGAGLVGQVTESWSTGSVVQLITDTRSSIGVRYGDPGSYALARGLGNGRPLSIDFVAPGTQLRKGEVLTTSGLQGALFPPGIPVAKLRSYSVTASSTEESVSADALSDLAQLQYVAVLQWLPAP